jgi:hypothetical protein
MHSMALSVTAGWRNRRLLRAAKEIGDSPLSLLWRWVFARVLVREAPLAETDDAAGVGGCSRDASVSLASHATPIAALSLKFCGCHRRHQHDASCPAIPAA